MSDTAQHQPSTSDPRGSDLCLLDQLADISRQIEAHRTAVWRLERQRDELRHRLIASGWKAPEVPK